MDFNYLAQLLFPNVTETPDDMEAKFPARDLPEGAVYSLLTDSCLLSSMFIASRGT